MENSFQRSSSVGIAILVRFALRIDGPGDHGGTGGVVRRSDEVLGPSHFAHRLDLRYSGIHQSRCSRQDASIEMDVVKYYQSIYLWHAEII